MRLYLVHVFIASHFPSSMYLHQEMPPFVIIAVPCEDNPCNTSQTVVRLLNNLTSTEGPEKEYDSEGAARFIIATVLVYSLMGVFGMMLLRIKRSASRSRRSTSNREESAIRYIKKTDRLMLEARRDVLRREAERTSNRLKFLRQQSQESNTTIGPCEFSLSDSLNLSASFNSCPPLLLPHSPTTTSLSLLMPLLPAVQENSPEGSNNSNNNNNQNVVTKLVLHFPALPPLTIPQTIVTSPSSSSAPSSACVSTPVTLVSGLNYFPEIIPVTSISSGQAGHREGSTESKPSTDCNINDAECNVSTSCAPNIQNERTDTDTEKQENL